MFEERGEKEDKSLEIEFRQVLDEGNSQVGAQLPFNIVFSDKQSNSAGLQLADLVARPIGRHILKPEQRNRAYDVIEEKLRRGPDGEIRGKGLKVFPQGPSKAKASAEPRLDADRENSIHLGIPPLHTPSTPSCSIVERLQVPNLVPGSCRGPIRPFQCKKTPRGRG